MLFSMRMWYFIIFLFIVLSLVGYFLQKVPASRESECEKEDSMDFSLDDHVFYTYTTMCARGAHNTCAQLCITQLSKNIEKE